MFETLDIEFHSIRDIHRVGKAMMRVKQGRQGMRERMDHAKTFLKGNCTHQRCNQHLAPGFQVRLVHCLHDRLVDQ